MAIPISHPLRGRSRLRPLNPLGLRPLDQLVVVFTLCNMLCQLLCQLLLDRLHLTTHHNRLPTSYPWLSMLKTSVHFYHSLFVTTPILLDGFNNFLAVSYSASDHLLLAAAMLWRAVWRKSDVTHWSSVIGRTYSAVVQPCCESVYIIVRWLLAVARIKHV